MTAWVVIGAFVIWILLSACIGVSACMFSSQISQAEESPLQLRRFRQVLEAEPADEPEGLAVPTNPNASPSHQIGKV